MCLYLVGLASAREGIAAGCIMGRLQPCVISHKDWRAGQNKTANTYVIEIAI
jgi:hypothetical protein